MSAYPPDWPEIAKRVKDEAGWCCIRCTAPHSREGWRILTVHHLDGDKTNCRWWNLAALCQRCHLKIQGRVKMQQTYLYPHSDWFRPYVAGFYAFTVLGEDMTRAEVEARMDELLTAGRRVDDVIERAKRFIAGKRAQQDMFDGVREATANLAPEEGSGIDSVTLSTGSASLTLHQGDGEKIRRGEPVGSA